MKWNVDYKFSFITSLTEALKKIGYYYLIFSFSKKGVT